MRTRYRQDYGTPPVTYLLLVSVCHILTCLRVVWLPPFSLGRLQYLFSPIYQPRLCAVRLRQTCSPPAAAYVQLHLQRFVRGLARVGCGARCPQVPRGHTSRLLPKGRFHFTRLTIREAIPRFNNCILLMSHTGRNKFSSGKSCFRGSLRIAHIYSSISSTGSFC